MPADFYAQTPDANILATEAAMNTIRTADLLFDRIGQVLRPLGVSAAGGLVLGLLRDRGPMPPSELGERLIVTRATVTGLVARFHDPSRGRILVNGCRDRLRVRKRRPTISASSSVRPVGLKPSRQNSAYDSAIAIAGSPSRSMLITS